MKVTAATVGNITVVNLIHFSSLRIQSSMHTKSLRIISLGFNIIHQLTDKIFVHSSNAGLKIKNCPNVLRITVIMY
jgi:hypothetical protein